MQRNYHVSYAVYPNTWLYSINSLDARNFHLGSYSPGSLGDEISQKLKQFADVVHRFWLQKRSKFENFAPRFLSNEFHGGAGLSDMLIGGLSPRAHAWGRH